MINDIQSLLIIIKLELKQCFDSLLMKFFIFIQPIFFTLMLYFINTSITNGTDIIFRSALISLWGSLCFSTLSLINKERMFGTFSYITNVPVSFMSIMFSKLLASVLSCFASAIIPYIIVKFILQLDIMIKSPFFLIPALLYTIFTFVSFSLFICSFFARDRDVFAYSNALEYPVFLLCGMVVPVTNIGFPLFFISYILPPTYGVSMLRECFYGITGNFIFYIIIGCLVSTLFLLLSHFLFRKNVMYMKRMNTAERV